MKKIEYIFINKQPNKNENKKLTYQSRLCIYHEPHYQQMDKKTRTILSDKSAVNSRHPAIHFDSNNDNWSCRRLRVQNTRYFHCLLLLHPSYQGIQKLFRPTMQMIQTTMASSRKRRYLKHDHNHL